MAEIKLSANLSVDAVEYASRANAILGIRDSGKSYSATMIAEQLFDCGIPFFAFDPIGRWRFLKVPGAGHDGRGFPIVVAGGVAPDLPLTPENAPELVRAAMRSGVSMVIDLYSIGLSKKDWRAIVRNSIDTILYEGDGHGQRHIFLEEASEFIPQRVRDGNTYAAVEKLARMGGNVGVGVTLINQRAEEVNKAVLELCDNLLLHRQRGKNSLLSLRKWLEAGNVNPPKEITDTLADLPTGQCWAWFKDVGKPKLIKIAKKRSFDPDRRAMALSRSGGKGAPVSVDVSAFVEKMKAALAGKPVEPVPEKPGTIAWKGPRAAIPKRPEPDWKNEEKQVDEKEAQALRAENEQLKRELAEANRKFRERLPHSPTPVDVKFDLGPENAEAVYAELKRRLIEDGDPKLVRVLQARPEIEVVTTRKVVEIDGTTLRGRMARLLAQGFYDEGVSNSGTRNELKRTGSDTNNANIGKVLSEMLRDGFVTLEAGEKYRAVPGMKVNVIEK